MQLTASDVSFISLNQDNLGLTAIDEIFHTLAENPPTSSKMEKPSMPHAEAIQDVKYDFVVSLLHLQELSARGKGKLQLPLRLSGDMVPTVDVLIPCCGEPLEVVLDTVKAACSLDYPKDRYRIAVLDDGRSPAVKDEITNLSNQFPDVRIHYSSRLARSASHSRAGNLNHGLDYLAGLKEDQAEFVAVLDIDMIPLPNWLRSVVPYLLTDKTVGLGNSRQKFYNLPNGDPMVQNHDIMYDGIESIKACNGASWCTGTGFVVRRTALEQIRRFPTQYHCDDIMTSAYLAALGWKIVYVPETVQLGLVPDSVNDYVKQCQRWHAGHMYNVFLLRSSRANGLATIRQRLQVTIPSAMQVLTSFVVMISLIAVPWLMFHGNRIVEYQSPNQLRILLILESLNFYTELYSGYLRSKSSDFTGHILADWAQITIVPFQIITCFRVILSTLASGTAAQFAMPKAYNSKTSLPWFQKLIKCITRNSPLLITLLILVSYILTGFQTTYSLLTTPKPLHTLLSSPTLYPTLVLLYLKYVLQSLSALSCILSPSQWPTREDMLDRDPVTKIAYPSAKAMDSKRVRPWQTYTILSVIYHITLGWALLNG
ncbi:MAG: hypothetical protein Q9218_001036 [Villophora microphyllina]